jgi:hypothetical protein
MTANRILDAFSETLVQDTESEGARVADESPAKCQGRF